jgi:hypothetical protein
LESPTIKRLVLFLGTVVVLCLPGVPAVASGAHATHVIPLAGVSNDQFLAHSEPALAINPLNHNNLLAGSKMFTDPNHYQFGIGTYYSMDGGRTWHDNGLLPGLDQYKSGLVSDVSIAFGPGGTAYICVVVADGGRASGVDVLRSSDGGKTFSPPVEVYTDTTGAVFNDKPWIAVDRSRGPNRGTVYVAWNADGVGSAEADPDAVRPANRAADSDSPDGIEVSHSTDGGKTFSTPVQVADFDADHFYLGALPAVAPDGTLYVAFLSMDSGGLADGIGLVSSEDGGQTFTPVRIIQRSLVGLPDHLPNSTFRNTSLPTFAISPKDGALVTAWADYRNQDADIMASTSTDGGRTWSSAVRVNHDRKGNGKDQFQPVIAVAPNGVLSCAWFDRRFDPNDRLIDEVVAQSSTDGKTWGNIIRVTKRSWDPAIGAPRPEGRASNTFIGDYQALAVDNLTVHPLWNDTENGKSQEIRTATIGIKLFRR